MNFKPWIAAWAAMIAMSGTGAWAALPDAIVPDGVGIATHFVQGNTQDLDLIAAAGIRVVRTDFTWSDTERQKGVYDWSAYDVLVANLEQRGLRPYFILDYSNPLYEQTRVSWLGALPQSTYLTSPQHAASVAAFTRWAAAAARHFSGHSVIWEIWNEPNLDAFWKPVAKVAQYQALALATCTAMRNVDASASIVAPAVNGFPWDYLTTFLASGILNCIDGVSVHPYRTSSPETAASDYTRLSALLDQEAAASRRAQIQIVSGEWGYSTPTSGLTAAQQADFAVRQQLSNLMNGVTLSVWYDWKNDGNDAANAEHNFGLVAADLSVKPAYSALRTMTQQLSGYHFQSRLTTDSAQDYVLVFVNAQGQIKLAYWTTSSAHAASVLPLIGTLQLPVLTLSMTSSPQYTDVLGILLGG